MGIGMCNDQVVWQVSRTENKGQGDRYAQKSGKAQTVQGLLNELMSLS